jgi:hypothetical protein
MTLLLTGSVAVCNERLNFLKNSFLIVLGTVARRPNAKPGEYALDMGQYRRGRGVSGRHHRIEHFWGNTLTLSRVLQENR